MELLLCLDSAVVTKQRCSIDNMELMSSLLDLVDVRSESGSSQDHLMKSD